MDFCRWLSCLHILVTRTFLLNFIGKTYCWHVFNFICLLSVPFLLILCLYLICILCFFSRKKLARRLLFDRSANDEHERSILSKLKQQCGGQFTSKMEGMVSWPGYLDNVCQSVHATVVIDCLFFFSRSQICNWQRNTSPALTSILAITQPHILGLICKLVFSQLGTGQVINPPISTCLQKW